MASGVKVHGFIRNYAYVLTVDKFALAIIIFTEHIGWLYCIWSISDFWNILILPFVLASVCCLLLQIVDMTNESWSLSLCFYQSFATPVEICMKKPFTIKNFIQWCGCNHQFYVSHIM